MKKKLFIIAFLGAIYTTNAQYTKDINTNRPSSSMGAYSVSKEIFQIEGGFSYQNDTFQNNNENVQQNYQLQLRYGDLLEQLEFIGEFNFSNNKITNGNLNETNSGFRQLNFGAKFLLYDHYKYYVEKRNVYSWKVNQRFKWRRLIPAISIYTGAQFNTKNNLYYPNLPDVGLKTMLIAQQHLSKRFSITYNFIGENVTENEFRNIGYIVTASLGINNNWSIFGEHQGSISRKYFNETIPFENDAFLKAGLTFKVHQNLQIDGFAASNFQNNPNKIQAGLGVSWRNHKKYQFKDPTEL